MPRAGSKKGGGGKGKGKAPAPTEGGAGGQGSWVGAAGGAALRGKGAVPPGGGLAGDAGVTPLMSEAPLAHRGADAGPLKPGMLTQAAITAAMAAGFGGVGGLAGVPGAYAASTNMGFPGVGLDALSMAHSAGVNAQSSQGFPGFNAQIGAHFQAAGGHAPPQPAWPGAPGAPGLGQPLWAGAPLAPGALMAPANGDLKGLGAKGGPSHGPRGVAAEDVQLGGAPGYAHPGVPGQSQGFENATAFALGLPHGAMVRPEWLNPPTWAQQNTFGLRPPVGMGLPPSSTEATLARLGANLMGTGGAALGASLDGGLDGRVAGVRDLAARPVGLDAVGAAPAPVGVPGAVTGGVTGLDEPDVDLLEPNQAVFEEALLVESTKDHQNSAQHFVSPNRFADILYFREGAQPVFGEEKQKRDAPIETPGLGPPRHVMRVSDRQALCLCSLSPSLMFPAVDREGGEVVWNYKELKVPACQEVRNTAQVKKQLENYKYTGFCPDHVSGYGLGSDEVFIQSKGHSVRGLNLGRIVNDKRPRHMLCVQIGKNMAFLKWCTQCHNWQNFKKFVVRPDAESSGGSAEDAKGADKLKVHTFCTVCHARQVQSREKRRLERKKRKAERDAQIEQEHLNTHQPPFKAWTAQDFLPPIYFTQPQNLAPSFK